MVSSGHLLRVLDEASVPCGASFLPTLPPNCSCDAAITPAQGYSVGNNESDLKAKSLTVFEVELLQYQLQKHANYVPVGLVM